MHYDSTIYDLLLHWYTANPDRVVAQSRANCHVVGMDSIMFNNEAGRRLRIFYAHEHHELWNNYGPHNQHLAYHGHHCALTLIPLFGDLVNIIAKPAPISGQGWSLAQWRYKSALLSTEGSFVRDGQKEFTDFEEETVKGSVFMAAHEIHTVRVAKGQAAAWLVIEGEDNDYYEPLSWSNVPLDSAVPWSSLYQPLSKERIDAMLLSIAKKL